MRVGALVSKAALWLSLLLIFTIPWENIVTVGGLGTTARVVGLFAAALWSAKVLVTGSFRRPRLFHAVVLTFVLWNALSLFWTIDTDKTAESIQTYIQTFVFVLILWDLCSTPSAVHAALQSYVLGAYVSIGSQLSNYGSGIGWNSRRFTATGISPNDLGFILALGIPVAWQLAIEGKRRWLRLINYAYVPLAVLSVVLTASRASFAAAMVGLIYVLVSLTRVIPYLRAILVATTLGLLVLIFQYVPERAVERLESTSSVIEGGDFNGRMRIWQQGLELFYPNPVLGIGSGAFSTGVASGRAPHNLALSLLVEVGIVGFLLYGTILAMAVACAISQTKWSSRLWLTVLAVWLLAAAVHNFENRKQTWFFLSLIVASSRLQDPPSPEKAETAS